MRQAAERAIGRRRDWRITSSLGKQHEDHINSTLDDIEARFGRRGRAAVRRAAEELANTYVRELYHEVIKLLAPLALSVGRLSEGVANDVTPRAKLQQETATLRERIDRLRNLLSDMRAFTDMPKLQFAQVSLREVTDEAASLVRDANLQRGVAVGIEVRVSEELTAEVDRGRLVQAFTNLICNATEAYEGLSDRAPVVVDGVQEGGRLSLTVTDAGCGMSAEKLNDAPLLFSTSKRHGTGFGLPLAIKIVESEHLGQLKITSAEGKGTCIEVWLLREQGD